MINIKACEIEFELDTPVEISREGDTREVTNVLFKQPNRRVAPLYEELVSSFNVALMKGSALFKDMATDEQLAEAKRNSESDAGGEAPSPIKSLRDITFEEIMDEVDGLITATSTMEFDYDKAYKLFDKILLGGDKRSNVCKIGGKDITDGLLDRISFRDYKKMLVVYIVFFGKPVKSGTIKELEQPQDSATLVKEL